MTTKIIATAFVVALFLCASVSAQTTAFTYQGSLKDGASPANGNYDFEFKLFDLASGGAQQGSTIQRLNVAVSNGIFTVSLDFGAGTLPGADRFLDIGVRTAGGGAFTTLAPRQSITSAPYAVKALGAANATKADELTDVCVLCVKDAHILSIDGSKVTGTVANAANAVNATNATNATNAVNATTANTATTAGNVTGVVAIANGGTGSTTKNFVDLTTNQTAAGNKTFTGAVGVTGGSGVFNGNGSGLTNLSATNITSGTLSNARLGIVPIVNGGTGSATINFVSLSGIDTIFGRKSFIDTIDATRIVFGVSGSTELDDFRVSASEIRGNFFSSFGSRILSFGGNDSYSVSLGQDAGLLGSSFTYLGRNAGLSNTIGTNNVFVGTDAGKMNTEGAFNTFAGWSNGIANTTGGFNTSYGSFAGSSNTQGAANSFFGTNAGISNVTGSKNTLIGDNANVGSSALTFATAIGANAVVTSSNQVQLGRSGNDTVRIGNLAFATATQLCINASNVLAACSSSWRYKENIHPFSGGLNLVRRMQPVTYDWIESKEHDLGIIAEEVAEVEPLLVTHNRNGEIQGVKYDQLTVVLVNAVKEQQSQIEAQQTKIESLEKQNQAQQKLIEAITLALCSLNPTTEICKQKE